MDAEHHEPGWPPSRIRWPLPVTLTGARTANVEYLSGDDRKSPPPIDLMVLESVIDRR